MHWVKITYHLPPHVFVAVHIFFPSSVQSSFFEHSKKGKRLLIYYLFERERERELLILATQFMWCEENLLPGLGIKESKREGEREREREREKREEKREKYTIVEVKNLNNLCFKGI